MGKPRGLTSFALVFGLKDILSNLIVGLLVLIYHSFHRNDHIDVAGNEGIVADIDFRYTTLQGDGKKFLSRIQVSSPIRSSVRWKREKHHDKTMFEGKQAQAGGDSLSSLSLA